MLNVMCPTSYSRREATISRSVLHSKALIPDQPHITSLDRTVTVRYRRPSRHWNWSWVLQARSLPSVMSTGGSQIAMTACRDMGSFLKVSITYCT